MLIGARPGPPTPSLEGPGGVFLGGQQLKWFLAAFLRLPPTVGMVLGMKFWASIISTIEPSFFIFGPFLATSTYLAFCRGLEASYVCACVKREVGGPNRPHDAHDAGSWGAAGRLKCAINPNKTLCGQCFWL